MFKKLLLSEIKNILKYKWVTGFAFLLTIITYAFIKVSGDFHKTVLSLANVIIVLIPLVVSFFTGLYWYYNDRYLEILLTQPIPRKQILFTRFAALSLILSISSVLGLLIPFLLYGYFSMEVFLLLIAALILTIIFVSTSILFCLVFSDRIKGMGFIVGFWIYLVLIHDGFLLLLLIALKDYPIDILSGWLGAMNPLGLARMILMLSFDGALLLGQVGAIMRNILSGSIIYFISFFIFIFWIAVPIGGATRRMKRKDF